MELSARSGLPIMSPKKNFLESHIISSLLTKLVRSKWLDIGLNSQKKELGQYPAILTSHLVNNPFILTKFFYFCVFMDRDGFRQINEFSADS